MVLRLKLALEYQHIKHVSGRRRSVIGLYFPVDSIHVGYAL